MALGSVRQTLELHIQIKVEGKSVPLSVSLFFPLPFTGDRHLNQLLADRVFTNDENSFKKIILNIYLFN
jgi:hypothetical protein